MNITENKRDFPGDPVVRTLPLHCKGHRFDLSCGQKKKQTHRCREQSSRRQWGRAIYKGRGVGGTNSWV